MPLAGDGGGVPGPCLFDEKGNLAGAYSCPAPQSFLDRRGYPGSAFCIAEGFIISGFQTTAPENVDALVVLGAQMKAEGPSRVLQYRLDAAVSYLQQNPKTLVIVSGGQGSDEHISEAQGMYDYLVQKGIEPGRILKEDRSVNTVQNLTFSAALLDKEKNSVAIVTNNFHLFRSMRIAKNWDMHMCMGLRPKGTLFAAEQYTQGIFWRCEGFCSRKYINEVFAERKRKMEQLERLREIVNGSNNIVFSEAQVFPQKAGYRISEV